MKASDFDKKFDFNENISELLDLANVKRSVSAMKRINLDMPTWMVNYLDKAAHRIGITRQALFKFWVDDRLGSYHKP